MIVWCISMWKDRFKSSTRTCNLLLAKHTMVTLFENYCVHHALDIPTVRTFSHLSMFNTSTVEEHLKIIWTRVSAPYHDCVTIRQNWTIVTELIEQGTDNSIQIQTKDTLSHSTHNVHYTWLLNTVCGPNRIYFTDCISQFNHNLLFRYKHVGYNTPNSFGVRLCYRTCPCISAYIIISLHDVQGARFSCSSHTVGIKEWSTHGFDSCITHRFVLHIAREGCGSQYHSIHTTSTSTTWLYELSVL